MFQLPFVIAVNIGERGLIAESDPKNNVSETGICDCIKSLLIKGIVFVPVPAEAVPASIEFILVIIKFATFVIAPKPCPVILRESVFVPILIPVTPICQLLFDLLLIFVEPSVKAGVILVKPLMLFIRIEILPPVVKLAELFIKTLLSFAPEIIGKPEAYPYKG